MLESNEVTVLYHWVGQILSFAFLILMGFAYLRIRRQGLACWFVFSLPQWIVIGLACYGLVKYPELWPAALIGAALALL